MDKNEELQKWLNDDRYIRAQDLMMTLNMDNRQVTRLLKKHKIHAAKRIYIGRHIDGRYLGQFAFFDKNQCLAFLEKWENGYDKHIFMSLNDICDTFNTNASIVKAFFKRNKIKKCEIHRDANNYRIALYDKQIIIMLWTAERGLLQNLQPNPDLCKISELEILFKISNGHVRRILRLYNIKPIRKNPSTIPDLYCKKQCIDSISSFNIQKKSEHYDNDTLNQLLTNPKYITTTELENEFGVSKQKINYIFRKKGIAPLKKIYTPHGLRAFYDRAECERARPFINQPEQKEVEKVENIGESATATKYQILRECGADDFIWDKVTMKNKIMPVKNYCDERGNFISLFKKDETVSAILAYKNEQKQLLEKCLANKTLVTTRQLESLWNLNKSAVYNKIYRLKIKPFAKIKLENGSMWHFYKKSDCIESQTVEKVEEKQMELPEPKEQTPDIIPADTIDLFTMSELESELKNRGVELTAEVRAKINASDMPEMQHIATMLRGNAKSITIRLSVLNEITGQLREVEYQNILTDTRTNTEKAIDFVKKVCSINSSGIKELERLGFLTRRAAERMVLPYASWNTIRSRGVFKNNTVRAFFANENKGFLDLIEKNAVLEYVSCQKKEREVTTLPFKDDSDLQENDRPLRDAEMDACREICISQDLKDKLRFMAMADNVDLVTKLESIVTAAWIMGNYDKK